MDTCSNFLQWPFAFVLYITESSFYDLHALTMEFIKEY